MGTKTDALLADEAAIHEIDELRPLIAEGQERGFLTVEQIASSLEEVEVTKEQVAELLLQALETEKGGVEVYRTALKCARNEDLKGEWKEYLEQTRNHVKVVEGLCKAFGLDPGKETPGRKVVRHIGESLVQAMEMALSSGPPEAAELVAAECVVHAETKDHMNWQLMGEIVAELSGPRLEAMKSAHDEVEEQEDEHLYHTMGWARELWIQSLGMAAVLPPPEEKMDVKTMIGAARAKQARKQLV